MVVFSGMAHRTSTSVAGKHQPQTQRSTTILVSPLGTAQSSARPLSSLHGRITDRELTVQLEDKVIPPSFSV